jgi:hypothetical protein
MLPLTLWGAAVPHCVATVNVLTVDPPVKLLVSVKVIVVPHANAGVVENWNGTELKAVPSIKMFGYGETPPALIFTPGVAVVSVDVMFRAVAQP